MKRTFSLLLGVLALALMPAFAQQAPTTGKIHGHVINPTGAMQGVGTVTLLPESGRTDNAPVFQVDGTGAYAGELPVGTYKAVYRSPGMDKDKEADELPGIKIVAGQDVEANIDMSRASYIEKLSPEEKKQLEDLKNKNSAALKANEVIKNLNNDLKTSTQDSKDADAATATAQQELGAGATKAAVDAKAAEIKTAKYTEIETMMSKDTAAKPDAAILWAYLGQAKSGLKKWDEAEAAYKKAIEVDAASKKPNTAVQGMAQSGLGEVYARQNKTSEASAAYDAAAKADPTKAGFYLRNEAVIFSQTGNADAQVAAANEAIKVEPDNAILYYLKGQGLVGKATFDDKTKMIVLPPGCADAYQKYLELAPTGQFANDVKGILQQAGQKVQSSYKAGKKS